MGSNNIAVLENKENVMSRYIDADALIERWNEMTIRGRTEFDQEIMLAPTIDAIPIEHINLMNLVEVVRCKECYMCDEEMWCSFYDSIMEPDDFCSYGERKESE